MSLGEECLPDEHFSGDQPVDGETGAGRLLFLMLLFLTKYQPGPVSNTQFIE